MKKTICKVQLYLAIIIFAVMILSTKAVFAADINHKSITQELIQIPTMDTY